jgi:hypothetical protein
MGISFFVMPNTAPEKVKLKRGRPATGSKTVKLSASISPELLQSIRNAAARSDETLSGFVSRALQAALGK